MEIKFRFWSESAKKTCDWETAKKECDRLSLLSMKGFIPMQFTGLKDKNGKEIYEGDIVEIPYQTDDIECIQRVVFWDDERACFSTAQEEDCDDDDILAKGIKVIGNIYENPELLKG